MQGKHPILSQKWQNLLQYEQDWRWLDAVRCPKDALVFAAHLHIIRPSDRLERAKTHNHDIFFTNTLLPTAYFGSFKPFPCFGIMIDSKKL
jgi:hypothetical protein